MSDVYCDKCGAPCAYDSYCEDCYDELKDAVECAHEKIMELMDCLESLVDNQNGCPLPDYEEDWSQAMYDAYVLLGRANPGFWLEK